MVGHLVLELGDQRFVARGDTAEDIGDGAEVRVGSRVEIGICGNGASHGERSGAGHVERYGRGRGEVGVDEVGQTAAPRSQPGNAEDVVFGELLFQGQVGLMNLRNLEVWIDVEGGCVAAGTLEAACCNDLRELRSAGAGSGIKSGVDLSGGNTGADQSLIKRGIDGASEEHAVAAAEDGSSTAVNVISKSDARAEIVFVVMQVRGLR